MKKIARALQFLLMFCLFVYTGVAFSRGFQKIDGSVVPFARTGTEARSYFRTGFKEANNKYDLMVRHQGSNIVGFKSNFPAYTKTGLVVPNPIGEWQSGSSTRSSIQTTVQMNGYEIGSYLNTDNSPYLTGLPKHSSWEYMWTNRPRPFITSDKELMVQAQVKLPLFIAHNFNTNNIAPVGQVFFAFNFVDRTTGIIIPYVIGMYDSRPSYNGFEFRGVDEAGRSYIGTSFKRNRVGMRYSTLRSDNGGGIIPAHGQSMNFFERI